MFWKKKKKNFYLSLEEIEQRWGSVPAFLEEQRRCAGYELENYARQLESNRDYTPPLAQHKTEKPVKAAFDKLPVLTDLPKIQANYWRFLRWLYANGKLKS